MKNILILLLSILYISVNGQTYQKIKVNEIDTKDSSQLKLLKPLKFSDLTVQSTAVTSTLFSNWNSSYNLSHTHTNYSALNNITASGDGSQFLANDGNYKTVVSADSSKFKSIYQASLDTSKLHNQIILKQDALVSGINIKTINNTSVLGSGNITVSGSAMTSQQIIDSISFSESLSISLNIPFTKPLGEITPYQMTENLILTVDTANAISGASTTYQVIGNGDTIFHRGYFSPSFGSESDTLVATNESVVYTFLGGCFGSGDYRRFKFSLIDTITDPNYIAQLSTPSVTGVALNTDSLRFYWSNITNNQGYKITISSDEGSTFPDTIDLNQDIVADTITGLSEGTRRDVKVQAIGDGINYLSSNWSDVANATTNLNEAPYFDAISGVAPSGTAQVGQTLTAPTLTYHDAENDPAGTHTYQWYNSSSSGGTYSAITGANSTTYELQAEDEDMYVKFGGTPVATSGTTPGSEVLSAATEQVQAEVQPVAIFTTDAGGASNIGLGFTVTSGLLRWDMGDGTIINANSVNYNYADNSTKTINVYLGTVPSVANITNIGAATGQKVLTADLTSLTALRGDIAFNNCTDMTSLLLPNSSQAVTSLYINGTKIVSLDFSGLTGFSGTLYISGVTTLTSLICPTTNSLITQFSASGMTNLATITNLAGLSNLSGTFILGANVSAFTFSSTENNNTFSTFSFGGNLSFTSVDLSSFKGTIASLTTGGTNFTTLTGFDWIKTGTTAITIQSSALTQETVDAIIHAAYLYFNSNTPTNNLTIALNAGTSASPSAAGFADEASLISIFTGAGKTFTLYHN